MATKSLARCDHWIKSFHATFDDLNFSQKLARAGIWWNGSVPENLLRGLLAALWMRARSVAQALALAESVGLPLPKKGIYRFLNTRSLDLRAVLRATVTAENSDHGDAILLDDTPSRRTGMQLPGVSFIYSSAQKAKVLGYQLVTLFHFGRSASGFIDFEVSVSKRIPDQNRRRGRPTAEVLRAKRLTKYQLALEMLARARRVGNKARLVIFDSWYGHSVEFLLNVMCKGYDFVTRLKDSRSLLFEQETRTITKIWRRLTRFRRYDERTKYRAIRAGLPNFGEVKAVFVKFTDKKGQRRKIVLICNRVEWEATDIIERYLDRATIEQGYKVTKQDLGLNDAHLATFWGQINEMALAFLAYLLAATVRIKGGRRESVAGILLRVRTRIHTWSRFAFIRLLMRRLGKYIPEDMITTALLERWLSESMMRAGS